MQLPCIEGEMLDINHAMTLYNIKALYNYALFGVIMCQKPSAFRPLCSGSISSCLQRTPTGEEIGALHSFAWPGFLLHVPCTYVWLPIAK